MDEQKLPEQTNDTNRIIPINIEEQMKAAYIDYSMSVIVGRALPDFWVNTIPMVIQPFMTHW